MVVGNTDIQVPVMVDFNDEEGKCDITIPDMNMTIHGTSYTAAVADAVLKMSAYYYYCADRNIKLTFTHTYESVAAMCDDATEFVTFLGIY